MAMFRMFKGGRSSVIHALRCSMCNRIVSGRVVMRSRRGKGELVAAEFGRPLFKECADSFATILREITANLFLDLLSQRQSQRNKFAVISLRIVAKESAHSLK